MIPGSSQALAETEACCRLDSIEFMSLGAFHSWVLLDQRGAWLPWASQGPPILDCHF
jgi:hypothetical protein